MRGPTSIATFVPRDRSLSPTEIRILLTQLDHVATLPTIRLGVRLFLMTMVRKSELQDAVWDKVDFENAVWTIPKERVKPSKARNVYLSTQALDIFIALKTCAGNSRYVLPSRYDSDAPMSRATFNRVTTIVQQLAVGIRRHAEVIERTIVEAGNVGAQQAFRAFAALGRYLSIEEPALFQTILRQLPEPSADSLQTDGDRFTWGEF